MSKRLVLLTTVLIVAPLQLSHAANTPTVAASVTGYTAIGVGAIPQSDWVPITVTRNDRPNHAEASGSGGSFMSTPIGPGLHQFIFTSASAAGFAAADPGVLHIYGSDLAIAQPAPLAPNVPGAPNTHTVYTNIQVGASFTDYLTVDAPGKAVGTPVQVPFHYLAEVVSNTTLGYPQYSVHPIGVYASFNITGIGPQNFSTESGSFPFTRTELPNGNGVYTIRSNPFSVDAHVGDVLTISTVFSVFGQANITDFNHQDQFGAFADGRNTAAIWLGNLPNGLVITSASGHDYRIDPTLITAAVPEPESYAMMLCGLALVGFVARCRKHSASVQRA